MYALRNRRLTKPHSHQHPEAIFSLRRDRSIPHNCVTLGLKKDYIMIKERERVTFKHTPTHILGPVNDIVTHINVRADAFVGGAVAPHANETLMTSCGASLATGE